MNQSLLRQPYEPVDLAQASPNRRQISKLRTRGRVLEAARALFIERGYEAATVRDIARAAGMSTGAVFANFQDKSDLFEAVILEDFDRVAELMRAAAVGPSDLASTLAAIFTAGYDYYFDSLPLVQATVSQSWLRPLNAELRGRAPVKILLGIVGDALRDAARKGEIRQDFDVRLASELLWDAYLANFRHAIYEGWSVENLSARVSDQVGLVIAGFRTR